MVAYSGIGERIAIRRCIRLCKIISLWPKFSNLVNLYKKKYWQEINKASRIFIDDDGVLYVVG